MKVSNLAINDPPTVGWRESQNQIVHGTKQMVCKIKQEKTQEPTVHTMFSGFPITILFFLSFHHHKSHHPYHLHFLTSPFTTVMVFFESKSKLKIKCSIQRKRNQLPWHDCFSSNSSVWLSKKPSKLGKTHSDGPLIPSFPTKVGPEIYLDPNKTIPFSSGWKFYRSGH
jgi:hypothetical protein